MRRLHRRTPQLDRVLSVVDVLCATRDAVAEWLFGPHCPHGCGQRVYLGKDLVSHTRLDHAGDRP